jgi:hypothetical protein
MFEGGKSGQKKLFGRKAKSMEMSSWIADKSGDSREVI